MAQSISPPLVFDAIKTISCFLLSLPVFFGSAVVTCILIRTCLSYQLILFAFFRGLIALVSLSCLYWRVFFLSFFSCCFFIGLVCDVCLEVWPLVFWQLCCCLVLKCQIYNARVLNEWYIVFALSWKGLLFINADPVCYTVLILALLLGLASNCDSRTHDHSFLRYYEMTELIYRLFYRCSIGWPQR